jgi:hypothetical protein
VIWQFANQFHIRKINVTDLADLERIPGAEGGRWSLPGGSTSGERKKESVGITSVVGTEAIGTRLLPRRKAGLDELRAPQEHMAAGKHQCRRPRATDFAHFPPTTQTVVEVVSQSRLHYRFHQLFFDKKDFGNEWSVPLERTEEHAKVLKKTMKSLETRFFAISRINNESL